MNPVISKLLKDKQGAMYTIVAMSCVFLIMTVMILSEVLRVYDIRQHLHDELYRASNIAVKTAMLDSFMWDTEGRMDEAAAVNAFYDYIHNDLGLNAALEMRQGGEVVYTLVILDIRPDGGDAQIEVDTMAFADLRFFRFLGRQWEVPVRVRSRNIPLF